MNIFSRINMAGKIGIIVVALLIPLAAVGFFFMSNQNAQIEFARKQSAGIHYYHPLEEITGRVAEHSALMAAYLAGDKSGAARISALEQEMTAQIAQMDQIDARYGGGSHSQVMWQDIKKDWSALAAKGMGASPPESVALHESLTDKVFEMKQFIADNWNLSLDPQATSNYMIDTAVMKSPELERDVGRLRTAMSAAAAAGKIGTNDIRAIDVELFEIAEVVKAVRANLDTAVSAAANDSAQNGTALRAQFGDKQAKMEAAVAGLIQFVRARILTPDGVHATVAQVTEASQSTAEVIDVFQDAVQDPLVVMLDARAAHKALVRNWTIGLSVLGVLVALALSWAVSSRNARQMKYAMRVFKSISEGKYESKINAIGSDEAAQVLTALSSMQERIRTLIETERAQAGENQRIRQALDKVSSYVMLADQDNNIIYMNDSVLGMFQSYAADIRKQLPNFDPSRLIGSNVDVFHANPSHQNRLLSTLQGTHTASMEIGGKALRISATPVTNADGARLGTVVEWRDMTQELAVEKEVQFIVAKALEGDLTRRIRISDKSGFFEVLGKGINQLLDNTTDLVRQITVSAADVRIGADEISRGNANLSQRTEQQAASLEETASSMEQMTSTVRNNADNASQASQLASNARREAEGGGEVVQAAVRAMQDISQSSRRIADIIGVIDEIAFQTNLLALNAAVEAARAGEQGRGFAVVASEVRSLAGRSASAAKEIKALIQDSVTKVADGTKLVDQSGETLNAIVMSVKKVADIVAEIAAANQEQSTGIDQVDKAVTQMDQLTQQNAALVEEVAAASETLRDQAVKLSTFMERYRADNTALAPSSAPPPVRKVVAEKHKAPAAERRSGVRPWAKKETDAASGDPASTSKSGGARAVGADSAGDVWKEF